jgi:CubicO group peptidase (beta-lactamase class C family)
VSAEPAGAELTKTDVDAWLDGFMPYALESGDIAGAVVVVVKDGQVLTQRGFGYADLDKRTPVDPATTLFRTGSVSKLTTWTAVMQLVEQGKLDLDTDVNTYLDFSRPRLRGQAAHLRNIMTHTSGFQETVRHLISDNPGDMVSLRDYVKNDMPPRIFPPGEVRPIRTTPRRSPATSSSACRASRTTTTSSSTSSSRSGCSTRRSASRCRRTCCRT